MTRKLTWVASAATLLTGLAGCHTTDPLTVQAASALAGWEGEPVLEPPIASQSLTLYGATWALVTDSRPLTLATGSQVVRFGSIGPSVSAGETMLTLPAMIERQRYRYDAVNQAQWLSRYAGTTVEIWPPRATSSIPATLVVTQSGPLYRVGDQLFRDPPGKVSFPASADLTVNPALEWLVEAEQPWVGMATASYVIQSLGWRSEYTLTTNPEQDHGEWAHWADLHNESGAPFRGVAVTLVAGDVTRSLPFAPAPLAMRAGGAPRGLPAESFAGRYVYHLSGTHDLPARGEERLIVDRRLGLDVAKVYRVTGSVSLFRTVDPDLPQKAQLRLSLTNTEASGLGIPLPGGRVTVYTPDRQAHLVIAGEVQLPDTPVGQAIHLDLGEAFDVTARRQQTEFRETSTGRTVSYRIRLHNEQDIPVTVEVVEDMTGDWTITAHSHPVERESADEIRFHPEVPAHGTVDVTYTVSIQRERTVIGR